MTEVLKSADEWLTQAPFTSYKIIDPDGWDRANFSTSWAERITEMEMHRRVGKSTVQMQSG